MVLQGLVSKEQSISQQYRDIAKHQFKKSITAIHCKPATKVTFVQWKLMNVCLYHAYANLTKISHHRVHIDTLNLYFAYSGNNFQLFNEAFKGLQSILFTWNAFGELTEANEKEPWIRVPFLSEVIWDPNKREFVYVFGKGIPEQFYIPKYYASFLLEMQNKFSSAFTLRIYEIGMRYISAPRGSRKYGVSDLKELLAVQKNEYKDFKYFNRALKRAVREVNELSDINIEVEYIKEKRKIVAIKFYVLRNRNRDIQLLNNKNDKKLDEVLQDKQKLRSIMLEEFHWKPIETVDTFLKEYSFEQLIGAIEYVRNTDFYKCCKQGSNPGNLGGYLRKAVIGAYKSKKTESDKKRIEKCELEYLERVAIQIVDCYKNFCKSTVDSSIERTLQKVGNDVLYEEFERDCSDVVDESCKFAQVMSLGRKPVDYRKTGLYSQKLRTYLINKYKMRKILVDFCEFISLPENEKMKQNWEKIAHEIENGCLSVELPSKATMSL